MKKVHFFTGVYAFIMISIAFALALTKGCTRKTDSGKTSEKNLSLKDSLRLDSLRKRWAVIMTYTGDSAAYLKVKEEKKSDDSVYSVKVEYQIPNIFNPYNDRRFKGHPNDFSDFIVLDSLYFDFILYKKNKIVSKKRLINGDISKNMCSSFTYLSIDKIALDRNYMVMTLGASDNVSGESGCKKFIVLDKDFKEYFSHTQEYGLMADNLGSCHTDIIFSTTNNIGRMKESDIKSYISKQGDFIYINNNIYSLTKGLVASCANFINDSIYVTYSDSLNFIKFPSNNVIAKLPVGISMFNGIAPTTVLQANSELELKLFVTFHESAIWTYHLPLAKINYYRLQNFTNLNGKKPDTNWKSVTFVSYGETRDEKSLTVYFDSTLSLVAYDGGLHTPINTR